MSDLKKLCVTDLVKRIYLDAKGRVALDIGRSAVGSDVAQRAGGLTGKGITIAILDTGIFPHPDLRNRIIGFRDFINNRNDVPYDDHGHGTHVAGCAAGNGRMSRRRIHGQPRRGFIGTAPRANLVGVKVVNAQGRFNNSDLIAGIQWCLDHRTRFKIRILNLSLVSDEINERCIDSPLCQAVEAAVKKGLVVTVAAGNRGPNNNTITSPGNSPLAITVGAVDDHNTITQPDDTVANFSSRGPTRDGRTKPDIVAPGVNIISLRAPGSTDDVRKPGARVGKWYFTNSGTSMATPIVSGIVAQILQCRRNLAPRQVKTLLKLNAVNLGLDINKQGNGEVNVRFLSRRKRKMQEII
ncbi:S8 family peptidase [Ammoniphilus sp. 3BR4]|uniref:S8 family peptidase n=1 Tax=Ammoniphilus sp. 3BR4 TaxID=3158265 RepID=UPI003466B0B5